ncbi:MAG: hypothetical protein AB1512_24220 [Thermodesulfobacteriota bacterium]
MPSEVTIQVTPQGILIPRAALNDLGAVELEAVWERGTIVIRPRARPDDERTQVREVLRSTGILYDPEWETPVPVPEAERKRLAGILARGKPLSEIIVADRDDRL